MFAVCFTDDAVRDVKALRKAVRNSLRKAIMGTLAVDPVRHSTELRSPLEQFRSFHWRRYRVVFKVYAERRAVAIVGLGERAAQSRWNIYRRLEELARQGGRANAILTTMRGFLDSP